MLRLSIFLLGLLATTVTYAKDPSMMRNFLLNELTTAQQAWQERYDTLTSIEAIEAYQQEQKDFFLKRLGQLWDRNSPLNARVTNSLVRGTPGINAYRVETVIFESIPNFYVTGAMFLPDETRFQPPYPTVLVLCGHTQNGKAGYQGQAAFMALHGLAAFILDPIDQGERGQQRSADGTPRAQESGTTGRSPAAMHNEIGRVSSLVGRSPAAFMVWDMKRALDYLETRPDVDATRLGAAGTSGGGTQTAYIMALDDRIRVATASCYICSLYGLLMTNVPVPPPWRGAGPQCAEQILFGQLAFGLDHADFAIMRAPKPTLFAVGTHDYFPAADAWVAYRNAKRVFSRFNLGDQMSIAEYDGGHGWSANLQESCVRWLLRFLADRDEMVMRPTNMPPAPAGELTASPRGQVLFIDGAISTFDLNRQRNRELLARRTAKAANRTDDQLRATIRELAGVRRIADIPQVRAVNHGDRSRFDGVNAGNSNVSMWTYYAEDGRIEMPAIRFTPSGSAAGTVIYLNSNGKTTNLERIAELARENRRVITVDLRGLGQTQGTRLNHYAHSGDAHDFYLAYLLGMSYVGMRTEDLLAIARHTGGTVEIVASGETVGLVALHAAALEPELITGVTLDTPITSWFDAVEAGSRSTIPFVNIVHGALYEYDVPDLRQMVPDPRQ